MLIFTAKKMIDLVLGDVQALRDRGLLGYTAVHCCYFLPKLGYKRT